uniref:Uncharacterized protein n=1 Tax=Branchiostoma floridae TaxID=7739 RepID=C3XPV9_BRAFL|eukprot:XP_002613971.1 hypothetical protein BRAFLDRAFT_67463 [Branchiostoma floridae]
MRLVLLMAVMLVLASLPLSNTQCHRRVASCARRRRSSGIVKRAAFEGDDFEKKVEILHETIDEIEREVEEAEEDAALDLVMEELEELVEKRESLKEEEEKLDGGKIDLDVFSMRVVLLMVVTLALASLALSNTHCRRLRCTGRRRSPLVKRAAPEGDDFEKKVEILHEAADEIEREVDEAEEDAALDLVMGELEELVEKKVESLKEEDGKLEGGKVDLDGEVLNVQ